MVARSDEDRAGLGARLVAYLLDSVVLFAFTTLFAALASLVILASSDFGAENPSDSAFSIFGIVLLATMPAWLLVNVLLLRRRGQTIGQYVMGLKVAMEDGSPPSARNLVVYWLALHPLFFHPMLAGFWLLLAFYALTSDVMFIVSLALALLSLVAPLAALIFALVDPQHRALHDRLAGAKVVHLS